MKIFKSIVATVAAFSFILSGAATVSAQTISPHFNVYDDVSGIGDESDFVRIGNKDGGNTAEACTEGQVVDLWLYVHNGSAETGNGENYDGPAVATNTKIKFNVEQGAYKNSHEVSAVISADNAASVTDSASITCGGEAVALQYVGLKSFTTTNPDKENYTLDGDPINGASLGFDGKVPGCWQYRASMVVSVKVVKKPVTPPVTPPVPPVIPDTGAGSVLGIMALAGIVGALLHRVYTVRSSR